MKVAWLGLIVVVLSLAGAACRGGGGEKSASELSDDDLKEIVTITSEGLPWQLTATDDLALSNEEAAKRTNDPQTWSKNYDDWGRTGGHFAGFAGWIGGTNGEEIDVQTSVSVYKMADGAGKALVGMTAYIASDESLQRMKDAGYSDAKIEELNAPTVGDESKAYLIAGTVPGAAGQRPANETFVVIWRHAEAVFTASVGGGAGGAHIEDALAVAKQLDGRAKDALGR